MLDDLRSMESVPGWWELGYVGVVPEQRGHRYVDDLLARGTATLRRDAPDVGVRADTDLANAPMAAAFARAGYTRFATRREFALPR
jgi:RimJ/RimL family protein N-acetyltransferase